MTRTQRRSAEASASACPMKDECSRLYTRYGGPEMPKRSASSARGRRVVKRERRTRAEKIDFSDVPELTDEQMARARRVGRPPLGRSARELIAIRLDPDVLRALRVEATRAGIGYQKLIHQLLAAHVRRSA